MFFCQQKVNFILLIFKDIPKLLFWVLWASVVTHILNDTTTLQKAFLFIWRQKNLNFISHVFLEILERYADFIFAYFGHAWLGTPNIINPTQMFLCMPKINFIIYFFLEILHFKEPCSLIGQQRFGPQLENQIFARYVIDGEISIKILVFILDYFQEKPITSFSKISKKNLFWAHFGQFLPKFGEKLIFLGKGLCQLLNIPIIYHGAKNQKKYLFLRKITNC